jgi:hypothetical protein
MIFCYCDVVPKLSDNVCQIVTHHNISVVMSGIKTIVERYTVQKTTSV